MKIFNKVLPQYVNYQSEVILLRKKNAILKKALWVKTITIFISILALLFGLYEYLNTQRMIDIRKYNNAFYDERYSVLKEVTKSISEINILITYNTKEKLDSNKINEISRKLAVFNYAYLVLNDRKAEDSLLLNKLNDYRNLVFLKSSMGYIDLTQLDSIGRESIIQIGKIITNEKDRINSFNFKLLPF